MAVAVAGTTYSSIPPPRGSARRSSRTSSPGGRRRHRPGRTTPRQRPRRPRRRRREREDPAPTIDATPMNAACRIDSCPAWGPPLPTLPPRSDDAAILPPDVKWSAHGDLVSTLQLVERVAKDGQQGPKDSARPSASREGSRSASCRESDHAAGERGHRCRRDPAARMSSASPGASRSITRRVAAGVTSVGVSPVPPVVRMSRCRHRPGARAARRSPPRRRGRRSAGVRRRSPRRATRRPAPARTRPPAPPPRIGSSR